MAIQNGYCTRAQVKAQLGVTDTVDDDLIDLAVNAASRQIDGETGRRFWQDAVVVARTFYPIDAYTLWLDDGIATTTGLLVNLDTTDTGTFAATLTANTDYRLEPADALSLYPVRPYDKIQLVGTGYVFKRSSYNRPTVQITAKWGWPAVPDDVTQACVIQAAQLFKNKDAVFGAVALGDTGAAMRIRSGLNPTAAGLVAPYVQTVTVA